LSVDQQQLRNVALSALNTMLLDAGYPLNWGSGDNFNPASVARFGLDSADGSELYVLDPDKVFHLVEKDEWGRPNPMGYLPPETMWQLLGLQAYGFKLKILAPFNVTARDLAPPANPSNPTDQELKTINYEVTVRYNDGEPIPNAVVNALIFYSEYLKGDKGVDDKYILRNVKESKKSDAVGKATINPAPLSGQPSDVLIVLEVSVGDIHTATSVYRRGMAPNDIAAINIVGDNINLTIPPKADPPENRWILSIDVYTEDGIVHLYNGTQQDKINWGKNSPFNHWQKTFGGLKYMDPAILIFSFWAVGKGKGREGILMVGPFPGYLGSRVLSYGSSDGQPRGAAGVTLQRVVNIAGMTYVVEFTLWKQRYS